MPDPDVKAELKQYLQRGREALLWKLEGVSEYDVRRPLTPTATNLLGIVKHVASVEAGYLGETFGRPFPERLPWFEEGAEVNDDMYAKAEESRDSITGLYRRVWAHSDATIDGNDLDLQGAVPWWPEGRRQVTLHRILVHMIEETAHHCGHADIVRELIDGAAGLRSDRSNLPSDDRAWWESYHAKVERAARYAAASPPE